MKGLCHVCFSSNETLTLKDDMPNCEKCFEKEERCILP